MSKDKQEQQTEQDAPEVSASIHIEIDGQKLVLSFAQLMKLDSLIKEIIGMAYQPLDTTALGGANWRGSITNLGYSPVSTGGYTTIAGSSSVTDPTSSFFEIKALTEGCK